MRILASAALAAAIAIAPIAAFAGEGNNEPFPNTATVTVVANPPLNDTGSAQYQGFGGSTREVVAGDLEATGGNGHRESANALPLGFNRGNMFYAPKESVIVARTHEPTALTAIRNAGADIRSASRS